MLCRTSTVFLVIINPFVAVVVAAAAVVTLIVAVVTFLYM